MCGIVGLFDLQGRRDIDATLLARMNQSQQHRGPDAGALHREAGVGLGHRRLSIIDLASGQQPLFNEDHSVVVVYNGEIYNFKALAAELQHYGHRFRTHCDTEVIVHAWEQWGERCVTHFRGMFAFALWDRGQQTLFLARDRLGVKPLHYAMLPDGYFAFGSELKSLLQHPAFGRALDPQAVDDYFAYGYVPEPRTIFAQARKLAPGHTLCLRRGTAPASPRQYWDVPFTPTPLGSEQQAGDELMARLREAVSIRLLADVPLGAFLSGGVDSSAVVALMSELMHEPVNTCSISFGDARFDEAPFARQVAEQFHTVHHSERVADNQCGLIEQLAQVYDEPFADSSALPTYQLCQLARMRVTVALSGDGGDENLAGYRRYRWHLREERLRALLPLGVRRRMFGLLGRSWPKADWAPRPLRAKSTFEALARDTVEAYFHAVTVMDDTLRGALFSRAFRRELGGYQAIDVVRQHAARCPSADPLALIQYLDLKTYLPGDILTKVDRASMAHGLEVRVPLLDHELVEWISGLPSDLKLRNGEGKYLFKKALAARLPRTILYREKMGFAVPLASWFRTSVHGQLCRALRGGVLADSGYFDMGQVENLLVAHTSGRRDYSAALWSLMMFEAFLRQLQERSDAPLDQAA